MAKKVEPTVVKEAVTKAKTTGKGTAFKWETRAEALLLWQSIKLARKELEEDAKALGVQEKKVEKWLCEDMGDEHASMPLMADIWVERGEAPKLTAYEPCADWACVTHHADIFYKRLNHDVCKALVAEGLVIPGIEWNPYAKLMYRSE